MNFRSLILIAFAAITSPAYADEAMTVAKDIVSKWETAYNSGWLIPLTQVPTLSGIVHWHSAACAGPRRGIRL